MTRDGPVPAALRERYDRVEVVAQLHDVPPNVVHELRVDGRRVVLKRSTDPRGDAGVEGRAQRIAARETGLAPAVPWVGDGAFLAAYDETAPDPADAAATEEWCRAAGRGLARLHAVTFDRHGPFRVDGDPADPATGLRVDDGGDWPDAVDRLLGTFRSSVAGTAYADVVDDARAFLRDHRSRLAAPEAVLVHGWFSPEHVGVRDGRVAAVVDFEHALAGAAEYDLWRLGIPTFGVGDPDDPDDPEGWRRFRAAYERERPLPAGFDDRADAYRLLVGVSFLDSLATQRGIEGHRERADAARDYVRDRLSALRARWA